MLVFVTHLLIVFLSRRPINRVRTVGGKAHKRSLTAFEGSGPKGAQNPSRASVRAR
jgi:hypothetical protein